MFYTLKCVTSPQNANLTLLPLTPSLRLAGCRRGTRRAERGQKGWNGRDRKGEKEGWKRDGKVESLNPPLRNTAYANDSKGYRSLVRRVTGPKVCGPNGHGSE